MIEARTPPIRFSPDVFRLQRVGGVSRYFLELHRGLLARGVDSVIHAGLHGNDLIRHDRQVRGVPLGNLYSDRVIRRLCGPINALAWATWAHGRPPGAVLHATWYPERVPAHRPLVTTVFDLIQEMYPDLVAGSVLTSRRKRRWCDAADRIFTISETTRDDLIRLFSVDPAKVIVTYLGVRWVEPGARPPTLGGRPYLLYVGDRRSPYKNFDSLIEVLSSPDIPRDVGLVCFGGGEPSKSEMKALMARGVGRRVAFVPGGDDALLAGYYEGAQALVYPSIYEGFGLPPLEAMQYGCPVVCSRSGAVPEVVSDAASLFAPGDVADLISRVDDVLHDEELRAALVAKGHHRVHRFTWDDTVERTLSTYRELQGA